MQLDNEQIQKILPHRYPFLLVDKIMQKASNVSPQMRCSF